MSAKELGMIHSVNFTRRIDSSNTAAGGAVLLDLPGQLSEQLQRLIRQGQYFKVAGIDMSCQPLGAATAATVTGILRYYAPTKGRCAAYRAAFKAMAEAMKVQGITMRDNHFYDFKVSPRDSSLYVNDLQNCASFDGVTELTLAGVAPNGVFDVYNSSVQPNQLTATFSDGFGVFGSAGNNFVVNEGQQGYLGTDGRIAEDEFEEIPFSLSWSNTGDVSAMNFQWRPDPALYLAVMCGAFDIIFNEVDVIGATQVDLEINVMVAGWKSIMGNPDKKRRRRRKKKTKLTALERKLSTSRGPLNLWGREGVM